jgi:leader peptidase (prepilin peptidase) / N-methyltransferase
VVEVAVAALLGLLVGSFLNVVIHRLPVMMERDWRAQCAELNGVETPDAAPYNLLRPGSACPHCQAPIRAWQNIPVISYLFLGGRCSKCAARISPRYPLVEAATAVLSALVVFRFGVGAEAAAALLVTWTLIALAVIDFDTQLLPDSLTLPLLWAGLAFHLWRGDEPGSGAFASLPDGVAGALAGYLSLWTVYQVFRLVTRKEGMGFGDFKLLAALGAWLGWQMLPLVILLSAVTGSVIGIGLMAARGLGRDWQMPFGPYLAAAGFIALLWGQDLVTAYLAFART